MSKFLLAAAAALGAIGLADKSHAPVLARYRKIRKL